MTFEVGDGWNWIRIMLMKGFGFGGVSCKSYTRDVILLYRNLGGLFKNAALTVSMCCCMELRG
jgi:hypothetical protein